MSLLLLLSLSSRVYAQSSPHIFVGEATLDGVPVPEVILVQGINDGSILAGAEATGQNGKFTLFAPKPGGGSTSLQFAVGGFIAEQSYSWEIGGATALQVDALALIPAVRLSFDPEPPTRVKRGDRFQLSVNADTGFYKTTGGEVQVSYNPNVFRVNTHSGQFVMVRGETLDRPIGSPLTSNFLTWLAAVHWLTSSIMA